MGVSKGNHTVLGLLALLGTGQEYTRKIFGNGEIRGIGGRDFQSGYGLITTSPSGMEKALTMSSLHKYRASGDTLVVRTGSLVV